MTGNLSGWARVHTLVHRICEFWALLGGLVLTVVVLINAYSILGDLLFNTPFPGDFELTEMGVAIAAFAFLPYCQITGSNVTADLFTAGAGRRSLMIMGLIASLVALGFAAVILWRMSEGLIDYREYEEVTGILSIPIWYAFIPALISLVLLAVASFMSLVDVTDQHRRA